VDKEKLEKRNIIILIVVTVVLLAALLLGWFYGLVKPVEAERAEAQRAYETRKAIADRLEKAQVDQRKAEDRLVEVTGQVQFFRRLYRSLEFGAMGADPASEDDVQKAERERTWRTWMREYFSGYASAFTATLDAKAAQSGVTLERSIKVANPPQTPEDVVPPPNGFLKPAVAGGNSQGGGLAAAAPPSLGLAGAPGGEGGAAASGGVAVRATGTLPQLIDFFQRLNNSPILMVVQNIKLDSSLGGGTTGRQNGLGTTGLSTGSFPGLATQTQRQPTSGVPKVTASFSVVPYLLARGAGAAITSGGGGASSGGTTTAPSGPSASLVAGPSLAPPGGNAMSP
jgi:hypothetical protein